jgi:hypothetical protein
MTLEGRAKEIAEYAKSHWDSPNLMYLFALDRLREVEAGRQSREKRSDECSVQEAGIRSFPESQMLTPPGG